MPTAIHQKFDLGMNQDEASHLLPEGYVYNADNMICDKIGIIRKRGGVTGISGVFTIKGDRLGALTMEDGTSRFYSLGAGITSGLQYINTSTGVFSSPLAPVSLYGDQRDGGFPFQHYGFLVYPCFVAGVGTGTVGPVAVAGADGTVAGYTFATPASCVVTLGDKRVACAAADSPTTKMQIGQIVVIANASITYVGRVTALISTTAFEVYPTPTTSMVATAVTVVNGYVPFLSAVSPALAYIGGKTGMSYQGRVVLGNCYRNDAYGANRSEYFPRRFYWTSVLLENDPSGKAAPAVYQGATFLTNNSYMPFNYDEIPGQDPIVCMTPTGFGDALIFSAYKTFKITGNLSTQYGTAQSITWAKREIPNSVGCMSERSMVRTPKGIVFAHDSGLYITDGNSMSPLMYKKMQQFWGSLVDGPAFKILGAALIQGNHYYISGVANSTYWGILVNLDTLAFTTFSPSGATYPTSHPLIVSSSAQDPADPSKTYGLTWWDQTGSQPVLSHAQIVRLDPIFTPASTNRFDAIAGYEFDYRFRSRAYTEDTPGVYKVWEKATIEYRCTGGTPGPGQNLVTVNYVLDASATFAGSLATYLIKQDSQAVSGCAGTPIVLTVPSGHGFQVDDWIEVKNVAPVTLNANGRWRVQAVTSTTVTLVGSALGPGAYGAGTGTARILDQKDIYIGSILATVSGGNKQEGQGVAIEYNITSSNGGIPDVFEIHTIMHSWTEREPHVE